MSATPNILIVEDDPVFRRVMNFTVASYGLRVETAADGQLGFERMCQGGIDFLVTDLQMPVCTGLQLIEMLDESESLTRPPTILCTAKGLELDTVELMREKSLVAIMHKPFSPRKLGELILQQFSGHDRSDKSSGDRKSDDLKTDDLTNGHPQHGVLKSGTSAAESMPAAPMILDLRPGIGPGAFVDD
tara:strand:+ start:50904 stop:51467 length:564 start_codon:yes stop_codon:yes gene_type:complete